MIKMFNSGIKMINGCRVVSGFDGIRRFSTKFRIYKSLLLILKKFRQKKIQKFSTNQKAGNQKSRDDREIRFSRKSEFKIENFVKMTSF